MNTWKDKIPEDWSVEKFSDIAELRHGYQFRDYDFTKSGIKVCKITQIKGEGITDISNCSFIDESRLDKFNKFIIKKGDILIALTGATIGKIGRFNEDEIVLQNYRVGNFFPINDNKLSKEYLYQFLRSNYFYNQILTGQTQSAQQNIGKDDINNMSVILPPLPEQQAIAEILSSLDDKIELNLQTNKTLEEMANALYKNWFVDFGPFKTGKFIESELGMIPEGWELKELKAVAEIIMGQSPESKFYNENREGLPFHQGVSDYGIRFPTDRIYSTEGNRFAQEGDILFSVRAPVGKINIAKHKIILGRGLAAIRDYSNNNNFLFCSIRNQFKTLDSIGSGTVYNSVNKSDMEKINILNPTDKIKQSFNDIIKDLDTQYFNNDSENIILKQTRDYLLPKLISGEIKVKEAAKKVKEVL